MGWALAFGTTAGTVFREVGAGSVIGAGVGAEAGAGAVAGARASSGVGEGAAGRRLGEIVTACLTGDFKRESKRMSF